MNLKNFIDRVVSENKGYKQYHFVGDQLNTYKLGSLFRLIAKLYQGSEELGIKCNIGMLAK